MSTSAEARRSPAVPVSAPAPGLSSWEDLPGRYHSWLSFQVRRTASRLGARCIPDSDWVQDTVQDVYCRLLAGGGRRLRLCRTGADGTAFGYLARIAQNAVYDRLRTEATVQRGSRVSIRRGRRAMLLAAERPDPSPDPERRALLIEAAGLFLDRCRTAADGRTPDRDARIAWLALVEGWSSREISREMGGHPRPRSIDTLVWKIRRRLAADGVKIGNRGVRSVPGVRCVRGAR
jgi:DNA-directed RNA polymerase specialized sigma24 family protein